MTTFYHLVWGVGSYKLKIQTNECFVLTYLSRNFIFKEIPVYKIANHWRNIVRNVTDNRLGQNTIGIKNEVDVTEGR